MRFSAISMTKTACPGDPPRMNTSPIFMSLIWTGISSGVATFIRTQKLRPILKLNTLELWQEKNDNLAKSLNQKQFV